LADQYGLPKQMQFFVEIFCKQRNTLSNADLQKNICSSSTSALVGTETGTALARHRAEIGALS
jgi:hypothetical protein